MADNIFLTQAYKDWLEQLKDKIRSAQLKAALSVNTALILTYWELGQSILLQQQNQGWGAKVIDQLSKDLQKDFPLMQGFSPRNLKYMRKFAETYPDFSIVQQVVAQIPWGHNLLLLEKLQDNEQRLWYALQTAENGWSRNILAHQIELNLYKRQGKAITNFTSTLPQPQSDLAHQTLKDPYIFDFITATKNAQEREIEKQLTHHITNFLLELGAGFAFVGRQYHIEVGGEDFYLDLLFYHLKLRCYVVVELKAGEFKPEYAGKLNFYLSAVDSQVKMAEDKPSMGIILCKSNNNKVMAEYALRDMSKPIGIAEYRFTEALPENIRTELPTIEELEEELKKLKQDGRA